LSDNNSYLKFESNNDNVIDLKIMFKNPTEIREIEQYNNLAVIFISDNHNIAQFHSTNATVDGTTSICISLKGNIDFFKDNNVSQIVINQNNHNILDISVTQDISSEIFNSFNSINGKNITIKKRNSDFNRITIGYSPMFLDHKLESIKNIDGINIQYIHGFRITRIPLFIETGVSLSYNITKYIWREEYSETDWLHSLNIRIPVNISYKINLSSKSSIQPYTGLYFKINPLFDYYYDRSEDVGSYDHFFYEEANRKIFLFGWQLGIGFNVSKFHIGLQYGIDISPMAKIEKWSIYQNFNTGEWNGDSETYGLKSSYLLISMGLNF